MNFVTTDLFAGPGFDGKPCKHHSVKVTTEASSVSGMLRSNTEYKRGSNTFAEGTLDSILFI